MRLGLKLFVAAATFTFGSVQQAFSQDDISNIINGMSRHGITECNGFIRENIRIGPNWFTNITAFASDVGGQTKLATLNMMYGFYGDSVKIEQTYLQTPENCAIMETATITHAKHCQEVVEPSWRLNSAVQNTDFTVYNTATGVEVYLKNANTSNGVSCIAEFQRRITQPR